MNINEDQLGKMSEFYRDKEINFLIENLQISYSNQANISNEDTEFINKINPKLLVIDSTKWTVENIKALPLLNCTNIDVKFSCEESKDFFLWFLSTPLQLFNSKSNQRRTFEWEYIKFFIENDQFEDVKLFKTNTGNFLFIPLITIKCILYSGFRKISSANYINKQFADLYVQHHFKDDGFVVPIGYLNKIIVDLDDPELDYLNQFKDINQIFKWKHIELTIGNLGRLLEINKLLPEDFLVSILNTVMDTQKRLQSM